MGKRRRLRRSLAVLMLLAFLLAACWTGIWYVLAGRLSDRIMAWEQQQRAQGWTISHGPARRSGWPMAAGVTLPGIMVAGGAPYLPGGIVWQAGSLKLAVDIRHLDKLYFGVSGRQTLRIGRRPVIPFQATAFAGEVGRSPGDRPALLLLHASGLITAVTAADGTPDPLSIAVLDAAALADSTADATGNAVVLAATMTGVDLPPRLLPASARHLQRLSFDTALSGPVLSQSPAPQPTAPEPAAPDPVAMETAWRQAGGTLALRAVHLADGPLRLDGQGRFQLDAFLRPEGSLVLHVAGLDEMTDVLADGGTLTRPEARAIKAVLALMMRPPGTDVVDAPLSLREGVLSLGTIPLLRLPLN